MFRSHFKILLATVFLSLPLASAQDSDEFDEPLSIKEVGQTLKLAEDAIENAERAQRRDDTPGMEHALENYSHHMNNLERGMHEGNVLHDEHEDVAEIVAEATYKQPPPWKSCITTKGFLSEGKRVSSMLLTCLNEVTTRR